MLQGKPQVSLGGVQETAPSNTRQRSGLSAGARPGKDFASYMTPLEARQQPGGQALAPPASLLSPGAGGAVLRQRGTGAPLSSALLSQASFLTNPGPAPWQAGRLPGKRGDLPVDGRSLTEVRASLKARQAEAVAGRQVANKQAPRLSGRPLTGRRDIGMEDVRRNAQGPPPSIVPQRRRRSIPSLSGPEAFADFGDRHRNPRTQSFITQGFASKNALKSLESLGYDMQTQRRARSRARLLDDEAIRSSAQAVGQRRKSLALPAGKYRERSLVPAFYAMADTGVGALAAKFESGDEGIAAIGYDRSGGTSYGKYQISSKAGTMGAFLSYLRQQAPDIAQRLAAAGPANTGGRSGAMPRVWRQIAAEDPARFEALQSDFVRASHFEPAMQGIAEATGVAFDALPGALREVVFSTAVQHGPSGAVRIVSRAVESMRGGEALRRPEAVGQSAVLQTGKKLIQEIYHLRAGQFASSTSRVRAAVRRRLRLEMHEALEMLG